MLNQLVAGMCGLVISGSVFMAGWGSPMKLLCCGSSGHDSAMVEECCPVPGELTEVALPAGKEDVKNTKCIVMPEDGVGTAFVEHDGKVYHLCCPNCESTFKADPEKFIKLLKASPATYGLK